MLAKLHSFIAVHQLIKHDDRILLAVSGGIDSMVMADLFLHLPYNTGIAHCNFSLRGEESDKDEELVRSFSAANGLPFFSVRFSTKSYAEKKGISVQMAARELRYEWFEEIRKNRNYDRIAVAHNLNDNVETMLINLVRGTGLSGLSGMRPLSGKIIRPMLFATRMEIEDYRRVHNIIYREDRSNAETKYTRNKIRHRIIPVLQEINPSLVETLSSSAVRFHELNEIVSLYISSLRSDVSFQCDNSTVFDAEKLGKYINNRTILFELFRPFGLNGQQVDDLLNVLNGSTGSQVFTETHRLIKNRNELIVTSSREDEECSIVVNNIDEFPHCILAGYICTGVDFKITPDPSVAYLDANELSFPLIIRKWKPGDFFYPLGMKGKKKLSDYFTDRKYSLPEKESKLVLESGGRIAWILGDRIDDRFRIKGDTLRALKLKYVNPLRNGEQDETPDQDD